MAIYRTDRERNLLGDRVSSRHTRFTQLAVAVGELHGRFCQTHAAFVDRLTSTAVADEPSATEEKEAAEHRALRLYRWAYHQLASLIVPDWDEVVSEELIAEARERLFPMGGPTVIGFSSQIAVDMLSHLMMALKQEKVVSYPQTFFNELGKTRENLMVAIAAFNAEQREGEVSVEHQQARKSWDRHFLALHDIVRAYLRLEDKLGELDGYFGPERAKADRAGAVEQNASPAPENDEASANSGD